MRSIILLALFFSASNLFAQIVINEVCPKNSSIIDDDFGNSSDWIELYNPTANTIDLAGYSLSDELINPTKWTIEEGSIGPGEYLLIFASDKDVRSTRNGSVYDDLSGIGYAYADVDDANVTGNSTVDFLDYQDTYFGTNPGISVKINLRDNTGPGELGFSYAGFYSSLGSFFGQVVDRSEYQWLRIKALITADKEVMVRVTQEGVDNWLAYGQVIEGTGVISTYEIPLFGDTAPLDLTVLNGVQFAARPPYTTTDLRVYEIQFVNKTNSLHTNFKLSGTGETLVLSNPSGTPINYFSYPELNTDHSYGKKPDGSSTHALFLAPTPGKSNTSAGIGGYCDKEVLFSIPAGFYSGAQTLALSGSTEIRYTLDGSPPTKSSPVYSGPITINASTVVRATCMEGVNVVKDIYTYTYIIDHETQLPVVSVSSDPDNFFSYDNGILADGPGWTADAPHYGANYWQDWEIPVHVEYFDQKGIKQLGQDAGAQVFGGWSRSNEQKSIRLKAKKSYGTGRFNYKFFHEKNIESFKQVVLRNSGNDFNMLQMHDAFNQELTHGTNVDYLGYRPTIVFLNGEYWGIMNIREKINDHYLEDNHGMQTNEVDLAGGWGEAIEGKNNIYGMTLLAESIDLSAEANFKLVADSFDLENVIDYFAVQTFISNWDWPQNNLKFWRPQKGDRKYRYLLYDTDITLGKWSIQPAYVNQLRRVLSPEAGALNEDSPHNRIMKRMLDYIPFRNDFVNRYADLMNTIYRKDNFDGVLDRMKDTIAFDMVAHHDRWGKTYDWDFQLFEDIKDFRDDRIVFARNEVENYFNLVDQVTLTLYVQPAGAGEIKISTIYPDTYPWSGVYFNGVPVNLEVIANPGYTFSHWTDDDGLIVDASTNQLINFTSDNTITAHFTGSQGESKVAIAEINYNSEDLGHFNMEDWMEVWNYGADPVDISYWYIKDSKDYNSYTFPQGTVIQPNERLLLSKNTWAITNFHGPLNVFGVLDFSLSNGGERIRMYNKKGEIVQDMTYDDLPPWPIEADGSGYTLELSNNPINNSDVNDWSIGCYGGSPLLSPNDPCAIGVGVEEELDRQQLLLYPNPAIDRISVELADASGEVHAQIFDAQGMVVYQENLQLTNGKVDIQVSPLASGMYILVINEDGNVFSSRFVVY